MVITLCANKKLRLHAAPSGLRAAAEGEQQAALSGHMAAAAAMNMIRRQKTRDWGAADVMALTKNEARNFQLAPHLCVLDNCEIVHLFLSYVSNLFFMDSIGQSINRAITDVQNL